MLPFICGYAEGLELVPETSRLNRQVQNQLEKQSPDDSLRIPDTHRRFLLPRCAIYPAQDIERHQPLGLIVLTHSNIEPRRAYTDRSILIHCQLTSSLPRNCPGSSAFNSRFKRKHVHLLLFHPTLSVPIPPVSARVQLLQAPDGVQARLADHLQN